jgi:hypothetical protein
MKLNEKCLKSIIRKNLLEMAMDFETGDRPDPDLQHKLQTGDTPLQKIPMPATGREPNQNFQELLASERYKQIVQKVRRYAGLRPEQSIQDPNTQMSLVRTGMSAVARIGNIEGEHLQELEQLAVILVVKEMGIPEGSVQWDCKIEHPNLEGFKNDQPNEENPQEVNTEIELELANELESLNLERAKRRMVNAIIQGSAAKGQYMFHLVEPELTRITGSNEIINLYGILMSILDVQYWQYPDEIIKGAIGQTIEGKEEVDRNTEPPTIYARGANFPVLVHEIIKGVMELFSHQAEPEDKEKFQQVMELEDTLEKEVWDLRLGPPIWERIRSQFPEEVLTDEAKYGLQNWILVEIFKLEAKQFLVLTKEVMSGSPNGKRLIQEIYESIVALLNDESPEKPTETFESDLKEITDNQSEEDVNDFFNQLKNQGIGRAKEATNIEKPKEEMTDKKLSEMGINALNVELNNAIDAENWELAQRIQKMIDRKQGAR